MIVVSLAMLLIIAAAALVAAYVAYPQQGREVPKAPWLGTAMSRAASSVGLEDPDVSTPEVRSDPAAEDERGQRSGR